MEEPDIIMNTKENHQSLVEKIKHQQSQNNTFNTKGTSNLTNGDHAVVSKNVETPSFKYSSNINVLKCNNQIKELHTVLRDRETSHSDFKFYSDRLVSALI